MRTIDPEHIRDEKPAEAEGVAKLRPIRLLATVLCVLVIAEISLRAIENRLPPAPLWDTDEFSLKIDQMDDLREAGGSPLVLLGSSVMDVSVDPTGLTPVDGRPAYNAGLIGATPFAFDIWARYVVAPTLQPATVVIALSSRDVNLNGVGIESSTDRFLRAPATRELLGTQSVIDSIEWQASQWSALVRYRLLLRRPLEAVLDYDAPDRNRTEISAAGLETHLLGTQYRGDAVVQDFFRREPLANFALSSNQLDAVERLAGWFRDQGVRVVILDVPVTADYIGLHPNGLADYASYQGALADLVARTGVDLWHPGVWDPALFSDPLHLNGSGVERLTAELDAFLTPEAAGP